MPSPVVTLRTLARHLGVSVMTVSRAMRNASGVSETTRRRVLAAAEKLDYRPEPAFAILNTYRLGKRPAAEREQIAFLTNFHSPQGWRESVTFVRYFDGAQAQAKHLGYRLLPFWVGDTRLSPRRVSQILRERGIRGLLVGPLVRGQSVLDLDWSDFASVHLGRSLHQPALTTVSTHHFQAMDLALQVARARGYQRIGFVTTEHEDERTVAQLRSAYLLHQQDSAAPLLPLLMLTDFSLPSLRRWYAQYEPDLLLSSDLDHYEALLDHRICSRTQTGFLHLNLNPATDEAGIDQGHETVGGQAMSLLHLKLSQREFGPTQPRNLMLIDGAWREGRGVWRLHPPKD